MVGKNTIKLIKSLSKRKYRLKENLFLVEGDKMVAELPNSGIKIKHLIITDDFPLPANFHSIVVEKISRVEYDELKRISLLQNPQNSLAVCHIPQKIDLPETLEENLHLYLDNIQDPGNLGTIIRICDWYGIDNIFCSADTVDLYNPKVIQASMGSYARVNINTCDFNKILEITRNSNTPVYGTFADGANIYAKPLPKQALLVMGNEGNGINPDIEQMVSYKIGIPNFSHSDSKAESLNVSVATAILCSEFKRNYSK